MQKFNCTYKIFTLVVVALAIFGLTGCFTGVESTPKITYKDVKHNKASDSSAEQQLASTFSTEPFANWHIGKRFYVASPKISLAFQAPAGTAMPSLGDTIRMSGISENVGLTGDALVDIVFDSTYVYRTNTPFEELKNRDYLEVPFTIDLDLVDKVANTLKGRRLYVRTPLWFTLDGEAYAGRKFVEVEINDVLPANEVYPLKVVFNDDKGEKHTLFMTAALGSSRFVSRDFASLFSFGNPKENYPAITEQMWQNIVNTRPAVGMTKPEASLAIGTPQSIDRGHNQSSAYERWNYTDGRYLIFEDGLLVQFNR